MAKKETKETKKNSADKTRTVKVDLLIPDYIMSQNEELKGALVDGKLVYNLNENITKEFEEDLADAVRGFSPDEIVLFNSIIPALNEIQSFKNLQYDPENKKDSVKKYKEAIKYLGKFNTSLKNTKRDLKAPHKRVMDSIEKVYKHFQTEYTNSRNAVMDNFKVYLDEEALKKKEAEDKKKKTELETISKLSKENQEILDKQREQEKRLMVSKVKSKIDNFCINEVSNYSRLNIEGLREKNSVYASLTVNDFIDDTDLHLTDQENLSDINEHLSSIRGKLSIELSNKIESMESQVALKESNQKLIKELDNFVPKELIPEASHKSEHQTMKKVALRLRNYMEFIIKESDFMRDDVVFDDPVYKKTREQLVSDVFPKIIAQLGKSAHWIERRIEISMNRESDFNK